MARHIARLLALAILASLVTCQQDNTNKSAANSHEQRLGWVPPPKSQRSTMSIIWSCLSVFIICSWKCTHLNLPTVEESKGGWHKCRGIPLWPKAPLWRKWGRKFGYMILMAIAPEVVVGMAAREFAFTRQEVKHVNETYNCNFTLTHGFYARMGGIVLRYTEEAQTAADKSQSTGPIEEQNRLPGDDRDRFLTLEEVALLGTKDLSFDFSEEDLQDHAKADGFTKLFSIVQAGWLATQCIARTVAGLEITQLELMTGAFIPCALVTYMLWWYKPFDAERAVVMQCPPDKFLEVLPLLMDHDHDALDYNWDCRNQRYAPALLEQEPRHSELTAGRFFDFLGGVIFKEEIAVKARGNSTRDSSLAVYAAGVFFSLFHFAAWSWMFPHPVVQVLWRAFCSSALISSLLPLLLFLPFQLMERLDISIPERFDPVLITIFCMILVANILSRAAIIGLTLYCFSSMPAGVYTPLDWTQFWPHFS